MKKVLSIMLALMMLAALSVSAFAVDDYDVNYPDPNSNSSQSFKSVEYEGLEAGKHIEIHETDPNTIDEDELKTAAEDKVDNISGIEVVDIVCVDEAGNIVEHNTPVTVTFVYDANGDIGAVLIQDDTGAWVEVPSSYENGQLTLDLPYVGTIAIVLQETHTTPGGGTSGGGSNTSPQTGYNTELWTVITIMMVLCAGCCFVSARKKVAD